MTSPQDDSHREARSDLPEGPFDLVIVGGGINGAAVARDAVLRGLTVCLLEKGDFASGTSSKTSKMLHGGLRYLEQFRLGLVLEALRERTLQLKLAPHLTSAQTFVIPVYRDSPRGPRWIRLGVLLYDLLALGRRLGKGRFLSEDEVIDRVPGITGENLLGGGLYFDGVMNDARLCLANLLDARGAAGPGRLFLRNYARVTSIRETSPLEVEFHDHILGRSGRILADRVLRVVGPWTDADGGEPLLMRSRGVHIVLPPLEPSTLGSHGLLLTHAKDGRAFFVIPWQGRTLVGTTETPFEGSPDALRVQPSEVEYLLSELRRLFPSRSFPESEILGTFVGVRPLARSTFGLGPPGKVSRRHRIIASGSGLFTLVGGKYTTYRSIASKVLNRMAPGTTDTETRKRPLHGGDRGDWQQYRSADARPHIQEYGEPLVRHLFHRYGSKLDEVLALVATDPALGDALVPGQPEIRAEVVHGVVAEDVHYPADFICRRTGLRYTPGNGRDAHDAVEALLIEHGEALGAVPPDLDRAREEFLDELRREDALRQGTATPASPD